MQLIYWKTLIPDLLYAKITKDQKSDVYKTTICCA